MPENICNITTMNWSESSSFSIKNNFLCPSFPECIDDHIDYGTQCGEYVYHEEPPEACDCVLTGCMDDGYCTVATCGYNSPNPGNPACNITSLCEEYDCTDDGSYGIHGFTSDVLKEVIKQKPKIIYTIGPEIMMLAIFQ